MSSNLGNIQLSIFDWVHKTLGADSAYNANERSARVLEEAMEIAQIYLPKHVALKILEHVYSKPRGNIIQELGGLGTTTLALAENIGIDFESALVVEFKRIQRLPTSKFITRAVLNAKLGIGEPFAWDKKPDATAIIELGAKDE